MKMFSGSVFTHLKVLMEHHELLTSLIYREIRARYRQSILGLWWAFVRPMATVIILTLVFSIIAKLPSDNIPYPIFAFSALLPWFFLNTAISAGVSSLPKNSNLVSKIYFPRETLPFAAIIASGVDFIISFLVFLGMIIVYHVNLSWNFLYVFPILIIELLFIVGMTLFLSIVNVWYRDVSHAIGILLQLWMYLTPIIYPLSMVPEKYRLLYSLNPLVGIIEGFRNATVIGKPPDFQLLMISVIIGFLTFLVGYKSFKTLEFELVDVI